MPPQRKLPDHLETDPRKMLELLVGLPAVNVIGLHATDDHVELHIESIAERPGCPGCGVPAQLKGWREVVLVDLQFAGKSTSLHWHKRRWRCADRDCPNGSWTEQDDRIAHPRMKLTRRAALRATEDVGRRGRTVKEVADELGCDWHTVNDTVVAYGEALVEHPARFADVEALGLDETAFVREAPFRRTAFVTSIVDVARGQLLDLVPGKGGDEPKRWLMDQTAEWRDGVMWGTLDLSGAYKAVFDHCLPDATQVADKFHVIKLANERVDETRRRVQNETLGHRGRKDDPLYRARRVLTMAQQRLGAKGEERLRGLLRAGDPRGDVAVAWEAKEAVRELYQHQDQELALEWIDALVDDLTDKMRPVEVRSLGRTLRRWRLEITAWHACHLTNGPTEAMNNLIKRVKRVAFGFSNFRNYRIRALLYAGKPDWSLLDSISPR
jgi:transposase